MNFKQSVQIMIAREGGLVDDPDDPGKITKYGISLASHPELGAEGIKNLTQAQASAIYRSEFWDAIRCGDFPGYLRMAVFDFAVNSGPVTAVRHLQRALAVTVDGIVGPETLKAARDAEPRAIMKAYAKERVRFLFQNPLIGKYGRGWIGRIVDVLLDEWMTAPTV